MAPKPVSGRFDYAAPAEVFMSRAGYARSSPIAYRRFKTAAEAIQYAVEQIPGQLLKAAVMEVEERRFDHQGIRALYDRDGYPLARP